MVLFYALVLRQVQLFCFSFEKRSLLASPSVRDKREQDKLKLCMCGWVYGRGLRLFVLKPLYDNESKYAPTAKTQY